MNSREQLLTSLDANRIIEAIHWLFVDKERLEKTIYTLEEDKLNLEIKIEDSEKTISRLSEENGKLKTKNNDQSQRIMALSTKNSGTSGESIEGDYKTMI